MTEIQPWKPPTITELSSDLENAAQNDVLNMALSMDPPASWIKKHPTISIKIGEDEQGRAIKAPLEYIPVDRQRLLGKRIFGIVKREIISVQQLFNAVCVTVRLNYKHPITGEDLFADGVGAVGVQTDAGAVASDMSKIKFDGVMKAAPAAAAYAEKNAYDTIGRVFGGEIQKNAIQFTENVAMYAKAFYDIPTYEDLKELYDMKKEVLTPDEITNAERILNNKESNSYKKLFTLLQTK